MDKLWELFIEWFLGDQQQIGASMVAHPIKTTGKIVFILVFAAIIVIAVAYLVAWGTELYNSNHSTPAGETQMNFYAPVTITPGAASSSQPTFTFQNSTGTESGVTDVYRSPIVNDKTLPPLVSGESVKLTNQKMNDGYHNEMIIVLGVSIGTGAPTLNSITPPSIIENCKSLGNAQPGLALNGSMQYRIIYFFPFDCVSQEPIATGTPLSFGLNYEWSSLVLNTSTPQNVCQL